MAQVDWSQFTPIEDEEVDWSQFSPIEDEPAVVASAEAPTLAPEGYTPGPEPDIFARDPRTLNADSAMLPGMEIPDAPNFSGSRIKAFGSGFFGDTAFEPPEAMARFDAGVRSGNPDPQDVATVAEYYESDPRAREAMSLDQKRELYRWVEVLGGSEGVTSPTGQFLSPTRDEAFAAGQTVRRGFDALGRPLQGLETAFDLAQNLQARPHRLFERDRSLLPKLAERASGKPAEPMDPETIRDLALKDDPLFERTDRPLILDLLDRDFRAEAVDQAKADDRTALGWLGVGARAPAEGAAGAIGGTIQGRALDIEQVRREMGFDPRPITESAWYRAGEKVSEVGRAIANIPEAYQGEFATDALVGVGSQLTFAGAGLLSRGAGHSIAKARGKTLSKAEDAALAYGPAVDMAQSSGVSQAFENVQEFRKAYPELAAEMGITEDWAQQFAVGRDPRMFGAVQVASVVSMLRPLTGTLPSQAVRRFVETGFNEYTVENLGQFGQNMLRQQYDPGHPLWDTVPYSGETAAVGAALTALLLSPLTRRSMRGTINDPDMHPETALLHALSDAGVDLSTLYDAESDGDVVDQLVARFGVGPDTGATSEQFSQTPEFTLPTEQAQLRGMDAQAQPFVPQQGLPGVVDQQTQPTAPAPQAPVQAATTRPDGLIGNKKDNAAFQSRNGAVLAMNRPDLKGQILEAVETEQGWFLQPIDTTRTDIPESVTPRTMPFERPVLVQRHAEELRTHAPETGWAEEGGRAIRNTEGEAVGRTNWVPLAKWFGADSFASDARIPDRNARAAAVEKAINGEPMSPTERRFVYSLIEVAQKYAAAESEALSSLDAVGNLMDPDADIPFSETHAQQESLSDQDIDAIFGLSPGTEEGGRGAQETTPAGAPEGTPEVSGQAQEAFDLTGQTPSEARSEAEAQSRAEAEQAAREQAEQERADADAAVDSFELTRPGQERDIPGQGDLLGQSRPPIQDLMGENAPESLASLRSLHENPRTPRVANVTSDGVDAQGNRVPDWSPVPGRPGFSARQYVRGETAYQEVRSDATGNVARRGLKKGSDRAFSDLEGTGTLDDVLSGAAFDDFNAFFDQRPALEGPAQPESTDPAVQAARDLLAEHRQSDPLNRTKQAALKRKLRRLAKGTPADNEAAVLALDVVATRLGVDNLEFAEAAPKPDKARLIPTRREDGSVEYRTDPVQRTVDDAQETAQGRVPVLDDREVQRQENVRKLQEQASLSEQLASLDDAELSAMIDEAAASPKAPETSKPLRERARTTTTDGKRRPKRTKSKAENTDTTKKLLVDRAAKEIASSMGVNLSSAGTEALKGLTELFGGPGKLSSGLTFDEQTYAKAKPHFQAMLQDFDAAGRDLKDLIRAMLEAFGDGVKPYILRFAQDLRDESTIEGKGQETQDGIQKSVPDGDAGTGAEAVSGAAQDGADGRALAGQDDASAPDVGRTDQGRPEAQERPARGTVPDAGKARGPRDADRVSARVVENFAIERGALREERGRVQKARDNIRAIELVRQIEAEGRPATREEQAQLALYAGWGGLKDAFPGTKGEFGKGMETIGPRLQELLSETEYATARRSIQYAHYTAENVIDAMWSMAERLGFKGGKVFEPGMGVGHFAGLMPPDLAAKTDYAGVELDHITARIAKLLYPKWGVRQDDFTRSPLPTNTFDLAIGNVPFADVAITSDPLYAKHRFLLHDYFMAKTIDGIRPGGVMLFVTSAGTMNKLDTAAREYIADRADLVGAVRLPGNAFEKSAGTKVTTDILVFRKKVPGEEFNAIDGAALREHWVDTVEVTMPNKHGKMIRGRVNRWFVENPSLVLGEEGFFDPLYEDRYGVRAREGDNLDTLLRQTVGRFPEGVLSEWADTSDRAEVDFGTTERKEGSFYVGRDGQLMQHKAGVGTPVQRRGKGVTGGKTQAEMDRIQRLVPVRDALRAVYAADLGGDTENAARARERLNRSYDAFVAEFGPINKANFQYRRPTVIQQESARAAAREEARYAGTPWSEGDFDASPMIGKGATLAETARARKEAREAAVKAGKAFDEGSFDPADMDDVVVEKRPNIDSFMEDPESYRLRAIEEYNDQTGESGKRAVFEKNVISRESEPRINSVNDALLYVLNQVGRLDMTRIAQESGVSEQQAIDELGESIFLQPGTEAQWVTRDEYLSGNVRQKLRVAKASAERDPRFRRNVEALEAVQPSPLPPSEINANLGMPWIPTETVEAFGKDLGLESLQVKYTPKLAQWTVRGDSRSAAATATWGTSDVPATEIMQDALNRQTPKVYREHLVDGNKVRVLDKEATQAAQDKLQSMKERFGEWVWEDTARAEELAAQYNEEYNNLVVREFNGDYLTTPGIATGWQWRPHQTRVIARIIQDGNTYMGHGVGAGKTSAMIGAGMEMRRLGLVRKPMYVVPNFMLGQFTKEFYEQYPTARIMVADEHRFHTHRRKQFIADVANQDLDAVIITHSGFGMIPVSEQFQDGLIQQQIAEYRQLLNEIEKDQENRITRSRIEKQIERLEQRLSGRGKRTDQVFTFEEMGVDFLFVDEAHKFRKLDFATKMSGVKGIDPTGSKSSWDLFVKTRYLETINPGQNLVFASGTPITNTMAELYSLSRYLQPDALVERGLEHFDAWAGAYGDTKTQLEQDPAGGYKPVTRFAKFVNVPELSNMVRQVMDVVTGKQLSQYVTRPEIKGGKRQMNLSEGSEALGDYQMELATRMQAIANRRGPPQRGDDILLSVINDGRHAAIDMRLVIPQMKDDPGSKLNLLVDNVHRIWRDTRRQPLHTPGNDGFSAKPVDKGPATQMIFANLGLSGNRGFSVPDFIRSELNRRGVPKSEIAYIADFKSHVDKQRLFNDVNEGKVRILIGSTAKMGVGVNAQRRLYAVHNLDPLWFPADDEQRIGRIVRQGNMNPEVELHDYSTKGTYDSTMWGMMETKARFIEAFFEGDATLRDMEDLGEASQYEQAKAITTSDPRMIELTELKQDLERAVRRRSAHDRERAAIKERLSKARYEKDLFSKRTTNIERDIERRQDTSGEQFAATIDGKTFADRLEAGDMLLGRLDIMKGETRQYRNHKVGEIGGFDIVAEVWGTKDRHVSVALDREGGYLTDIRVSGSARGVIQSLEAGLRGFEDDLVYARDRVARAEKDLKQFDGQQDKAFTGQKAIEDLTQKVRALEKELTPVEPAAEDGEAPHSREGAQGGMTAAEAKAAIRTAILRLSVPVTVHATAADAQSVTGVRVYSDARGFAVGTDIHLIAEGNGTAAQVQETLFHEVFHVGVTITYGSRAAAPYVQAMNSIALKNKNIRAEAARWRTQEGKDFRQTLQDRGVTGEALDQAVRMRAIEEALAALSGKTGETISGIKPFLAKIQAWLRSVNLGFVADMMEGKTDAEALAMIFELRGEVTGVATIEVDGVSRPTQNSEGQPIHPTKAGTRAFWRWFGDSKLVDDQGRPVRVFHSGAFDDSRILSGAEVRKRSGENDWFGNHGIYFSQDPGYSSVMYGATKDGGATYPAYLKIENPIRTKAAPRKRPMRKGERRPGGESAWLSVEDVARMRSNGHDGYINDAWNEVVVIDPSQIKSATGNRGAFSRGSEDITFSSGRPSILGLTPERVDRLLSAEAIGHRPDTGKTYLAWLSPEDFVPATTPVAFVAEVEAETSELDLARLSEETQTPFLYIEPASVEGSFRIVGHEGRHRMEAAARAGFERFPVLLIRSDLGWTNSLTEIDRALLHPEDHGSAGRAVRAIRADNLVPLVYNNRDQILAEFSDRADIQFSRTEPDTAVGRQERGLASWVKNGQPVDRMHRFLFDPTGGLTDTMGRYRPGVALEKGVTKVITEWKPHADGKFSWMNPALESVRAGLIDRYKLDPKFKQREFEAQAEEAVILAAGMDFLEKLTAAKVGPQEAKVLQAILTGEAVGTPEMNKLAAPIREAIDELGQQMVALGLLEAETYQRHLGKYLHRAYRKYEDQDKGLPVWARNVMTKHRRKIHGDELKARGLKEDVTQARLLKDAPNDWWGRKSDPREADKHLRNTEWRLLDLVVTAGERSGTLTGVDAEDAKPKLKERVWWPADLPVPARLSDHTDRGTWTVTGTKGNKLRLRRDFTKDERESMGEILDARYNIIKTYQLLSHDIANAKFFKDIALNPEWATHEAARGEKVIDALEAAAMFGGSLRTFAEATWVRVPPSKVPGTNQMKWGALGGMLVRPEIWRDLNEMDRMQRQGSWQAIMNQWKINKALALDTPIPTPAGWTTMGDISEGDTVFDEGGKPCTVLEVKDIQRDRPCYRVEFSDGTSIVADDEHWWFTEHRNKGGGVRTTKEIRESLTINHRGEAAHSIPVTGPLELPKAELPIPPYALGLWVGDGHSSTARITVGADALEEITACLADVGVHCGTRRQDPRSTAVTFTIDTQPVATGNAPNLFKTALVDLGILGGKRLPASYLRASIEQRFALLRGLMDSDGWVTARGTCGFATSRPSLRNDAVELLRSLGFKPTVHEFVSASGKPAWRVHFQAYADTPIASVQAKASRLRDRPARRQRSKTRQIVSITPVESVPVRCIAVSSESHLYLAGDGMIPTHNTARSPVVHMNNVMSNFVLMDLIDVRLRDLKRGISEYRHKGEMYKEARDNGAFGAGFVRKELNRNTVDPLLDEILKQSRDARDDAEGRTQFLSKLGYALWKWAKAGDRKMVDFYQVEDEIFRMATFMRYRSMGSTAQEAALLAREQFLNYDIRAPWVNAARRTVLPFISYTYRAVPAIATAIAHRPWKLAKYITVAYLANLLAFELEPGDEDEERRTMRDAMQGMTWASIPFTDIGMHRMIRMPWRDEHDNPYYLDIFRWLPAGDVFDIGQGQLGVPAWLQFGGPLQLAFEMTLNRSAFTGKDIADRLTDTGMQAAKKRLDYLWKAWMPSAAYIPGSWHYDKLISAVRGERDFLGRPYGVPAALASGVGIKVQPHDVQMGYYFRGSDIERRERAIKSNIRQIQMDARRDIGSESQRAKDLALETEKLKRLAKEAARLQGR